VKGLRFEEFLNKLVQISYDKKEGRRIIGDLVEVDKKFVKVRTLNQIIYIDIDEIITIQPARKENSSGRSM